MKKTILMVIALLCAFTCFSQVVDFENLTLEPNSSWIGADGTGQFTSSYLTLYNDYNSQYGSWQGFAYTNGTDVETNSYTNLSSCVGHGAGNSAYYVTGYIGTDWMGDNSQIPVGMKINTENAGDFANRGAYFCMPVLLKKYVDNSYASHSYYFKLKASAYANGTLLGEREIVMADFTEGHSYKMDDWTFVDLSWINGADSLNFIALSNDDAGDYGINTPMYFCMDNFGAENPYTEIVDFENLTLEPNSAWIGSDGAGQFTSSYLTLYNTYEYYEDYGMSYWEGFAYTNGTDTETFDYDNLSAAVGHGHGNSSNYVTSYMGWYGKSGIKIDTEHAVNFDNRGAYFCLPTLLVKHINQVDFATNHYYYSVKVTAYAAGEELANREIVMADYRIGANYMMDKWTFVDLSWIANADSLYFSADGNELNSYGLNTPTYFCMDDFGAEAPNAITATAGEGGFISPMGTIYVDDAENQSFTITPAECYQIARVMVDETDVTEAVAEANGVYTFENVTADHTITATFAQITYTITVTAGENGTITHGEDVEGDATVNCGENIAFAITPAEGYMIETVTVDGEEVATLNAYTFEDVTGNHTIAATFVAIPEGSVVVMVNATEGGSVAPLGTQTVVSGENLTLTITPDNCKKALVNGEEVELDEENHYMVENITENMNVNVSFEQITYTITVIANEFGTITPNDEGGVIVNCGDDKEFTIAANDSCRLLSLKVDNVDTVAVNGVFTFENITADHTIEATFERIPTYTITVAEVENGTISPNGVVTVLEGQDTTFTITPAEHYRIASVTVDENDTTSSVIDGVFAFTNVRGNHTIAATFEVITYTITLSVGENGTVKYNDEEVIAPVVVNEGATPAFVITPAENYQIGTLTVDEEEITLTTEELAGYTYTFAAVETNHTLSVTFVPVSSADMLNAGSMSIYPNPNNGMFSIDFSNIEGDAIYQLIDARGTIVETLDINVMSGETMNFNHNINAGTYFVRIISGDKVYVEQIVIE